jgi:hypothetical protein
MSSGFSRVPSRHTGSSNDATWSAAQFAKLYQSL